MSVKIFVMCICAAIGTCAGYIVMRTFKRNRNYFDGILSMIRELKRNISYRRDSAASILQSAETESAQLKKNIGEYIAYVKAKDGKLELSRGFLSADEFKSVNDLFCSLGRSDGGTQIGELDLFEKQFETFRERAATRYDKYGSLAVKLGFLFGLGVGVLFL